MVHVVRALVAAVCGFLLLAPHSAEARDSLHTTATYYHPSLHGSVMANGQPYDRSNPFIAASNWYPLGTLLKVTRADTEEYIYVRVQDRGARTLTLDLSEAGFTQLGRLREGRIPVQLEIVQATERSDLALASAARGRREQTIATATTPEQEMFRALGLAVRDATTNWQIDELLPRWHPWLGQAAPAGAR